MTQCHFLSIILAKASYKASSDSEVGEQIVTPWWKELQSHVAKGVNTEVCQWESEGGVIVKGSALGLASDRPGCDLQLGCLRASHTDSRSHSFLTCEMGVQYYLRYWLIVRLK